MIIGKGGETYLNKVMEETLAGNNAVEYVSTPTLGTNHETIMDAPKGIMGAILHDVKERW